MSNTKKIIFDTTSESVGKIDALKNRLGFKTRSELFRNALALMHLTEDRLRNGYKIQFERDGEVVELLLPHLARFI